jgi:hypothetical protein
MTDIVDWVQKATPEQISLIERIGPETIVQMNDELQKLKSGQADKNRALLEDFLNGHRQTIGAAVIFPVIGLFLFGLIFSLHYISSGESRNYQYALGKVMECRMNAADKGWDFEQVCGKLPVDPYSER